MSARNFSVPGSMCWPACVGLLVSGCGYFTLIFHSDLSLCKPKQPKSIFRCLPGKLLEVLLANFSQQRGRINNVSRLIAPASSRFGRQIRRIRFHQDSVVWDGGSDTPQSFRLFERDHSGKANIKPELKALCRDPFVADKGMHNTRQRSALARRTQHGDDLQFALARVDYKRQTRRLRQAKMPIEVVLLNLERRVVPVPIKSGLTNRDNLGGTRQRDDAVPVSRLGLLTVIWLDSDGGEDGIVGGGQGNRLIARFSPDADRDHLVNPRLHRAPDNGVPIIRKFILIQVSVRIDQFQHDLAVVADFRG